MTARQVPENPLAGGNAPRDIREADAYRRVMNDFLNMRPPLYRGDPDPNSAEEWIEELEKIFELLQCSEQQKVRFATHMLKGNAAKWWNAMKISVPTWQ